jgi:CrcB protein
MIALAVGAAGAIGALCRRVLDGFVTRRSRRAFPNPMAHGPFPYGTLAINVIGSFALGLLIGTDRHRLVEIAGTGFCGGFTTWSTFCWESNQMWRPGQRLATVAQVTIHLTACLGAATAGLVLMGA